jgi:ubiquinone/menaquinone biosynthesis C-methylase UbiE
VEEYLKLTLETYDHIAIQYISTTSAIRPEPEFDMFWREVSPNGMILDIGCAWGRDCKDLAQKGFSVIGIDLSLGMLRVATSYAEEASFIRADLRALPIKNAIVDGIWCCATLLHLKRHDIPHALAEFRRVLRLNAPCYIQVKQGDGEEVVGSSFSGNRPRFFTYFQVEETCNYGLAAGFRIADVHTYNEKDRSGPGSRDQEQICLLLAKS